MEKKSYVAPKLRVKSLDGSEEILDGSGNGVQVDGGSLQYDGQDDGTNSAKVNYSVWDEDEAEPFQ